MNTDDKGTHLSRARLDKAIKTLVDIETMDDGPLYRKVRRAIDETKARRRRIAFVRACAAMLVPAAVVAGGWLLLRGGQHEYRRVTEAVSLTIPGERTIAMTGEQAGQPITGREALVVVDADGKLTLAKETEATPEKVLVIYQTLDVPRGNRYDMVLPDGTHVWLNSGSKISFPSAFPEGERRVYAEGEVYFEVAHDTKRPFTVDMQHQSVTVLGTSFNIYAYADEPYAYTTLAGGSVRVNGNAAGTGVVLSPGQQAVFNVRAQATSVRNVNLSEALAWRRGLINMEKQTLEQVTDNLARLYNVDFVFEDQQVAAIRYRGNTSRSEQIEDVLQNLSSVSPVEFKRRGDLIEVRMK